MAPEGSDAAIPIIVSFLDIHMHVSETLTQAGGKSILHLWAVICREEASKSQRGLWGIRAQKLVQDLEAEAATWKLLYLLHGVEQPTFPGGTGGPPLRGCGSAMRSRQQAAALIMNDQGINRCCHFHYAHGREAEGVVWRGGKGGGGGR